jgi:hypothetical protein
VEAGLTTVLLRSKTRCSVEPLARQIRPEAERYIAVGYSFR